MKKKIQVIKNYVYCCRNRITYSDLKQSLNKTVHKIIIFLKKHNFMTDFLYNPHPFRMFSYAE